MKEIWSLVILLIAVTAILALAYWVTRWIAVHGTPDFTGARREEPLCVLRQVNVGRSERLLLVRLQKRCLLIGVTASSMSLLTELTPEEAGEWLEGPGPSAPPGFRDIMQEAMARISKKK